jgi:long-chain acyl-CoA synthetase
MTTAPPHPTTSLGTVTTIGDVLPVAARRFGEKTALVLEDRSFTFADLEQRSNRVASGLASLGVRPGDRVTLYGPNCWEWVVAYYAIAKIGAVVNPISAMLTPEEVGYVVADSGARVVVTSVDQGLPLLDLVAADALSHLVLWGDDVPEGSASFARWVEDADPGWTPVRRDPGEVGAICYTSGTTGHPKGAMQSHRAVVAAAVGTVLMGARGPDDRVLNSLPLAHVYGSCVLNGSMLAGSTLVVVPRFNEVAVLTAIERHRATLMDGVPTAYYYLLAHPDFDRADLSSLTRCWVGGQTLPSAKALEFTARTGCPIHEVWGMTELAGAASANPVVGPNKPGTIGIAYPGNAMQVVDMDDPGTVMGPGERGELMFRGPMVMDGYYGNDEATRASIEPDGWLHSGDIATMDEDGYFTIVDRKTDMILTAGFNVYPAEVERVLCMHPEVALAAVTGVPDEVKGELAKAYVVRKPGATVTREELVAHCREHLAAYKIPRAVQFVSEVPITASGKIMRRLLQDYDDGSR